MLAHAARAFTERHVGRVSVDLSVKLSKKNSTDLCLFWTNVVETIAKLNAV
jgi:hypothetical protein